MVKYNNAIELIFKALADPTRQEIMFRLSQMGEMTVLELAEPFNMSLPAISRHLKILQQADLIIRSIEGRVHRISLNNEPIQQAIDWLTYYRLIDNE